jgi:hypothetical protein
MSILWAHSLLLTKHMSFCFYIFQLIHKLEWPYTTSNETSFNTPMCLLFHPPISECTPSFFISRELHPSIHPTNHLTKADDMTPPTSVWGVSDPGGGSPARNFCPRPGFFQTRPKTAACPARKQKNFALAFLKAAWLQIPYWVHFIFKVSNPKYMCTFPK